MLKQNKLKEEALANVRKTAAMAALLNSVAAFFTNRGFDCENTVDVAAYLEEEFGVESPDDLAMLDEDDIMKTIANTSIKKVGQISYF